MGGMVKYNARANNDLIINVEIIFVLPFLILILLSNKKYYKVRLKLPVFKKGNVP